MLRFSVGGRTMTTAAAANVPACALWNPSASVDLWVVELGMADTAADSIQASIRRTNTRGTAVVTVTPDIDNNYQRRFAPPSGAVLDLDYSADPTVAEPALHAEFLPNTIGSGFSLVFMTPIKVPAGTGLAFVSTSTVFIPVADVFYVWDE